jgi:hypothetical protein
MAVACRGAFEALVGDLRGMARTPSPCSPAPDSGRSGRCIGASSSEWLATVAPTIRAPRAWRRTAKYAHPSTTAHPTAATKLCEIGYDTNSRELAVISPGTMRTRSSLRRSRSGQSSSRNCAASTVVPSEVRGAAWRAAKATP